MSDLALRSKMTALRSRAIGPTFYRQRAMMPAFRGAGSVSESVKLKFVNTYVDNRGRSRSYFRRKGEPKLALPGSPGSTQFMAAYAAALAGVKPAQRDGLMAAAAPRSFNALAQVYYGSPLYGDLAASSKINYRRVIDGFLAEHGARQVAEMQPEDVDKIIGGYADRPGAGIVMLKRLRTLIKYAAHLRWISHDPTMGATSYTSEEYHTWTEDELARFEAHWPIGSAQRLGYTLALYTGQRGSDVHRMKHSDIAGDLIAVATAKSQGTTKLKIPMHPTLVSVLAATPSVRGKVRPIDPAQAAILVNGWGRGYTLKGYGNMMSDAIVAAGLAEECKAHGLRKAAGRRLAEAGATAHEIMSILGHKTLAEAERYTRAADQERMARAGMRKVAGDGQS